MRTRQNLTSKDSGARYKPEQAHTELNNLGDAPNTEKRKLKMLVLQDMGMVLRHWSQWLPKMTQELREAAS